MPHNLEFAILRHISNLSRWRLKLQSVLVKTLIIAAVAILLQVWITTSSTDPGLTNEQRGQLLGRALFAHFLSIPITWALGKYAFKNPSWLMVGLSYIGVLILLKVIS